MPFHRVYHDEWVVVYSSDAAGDGGRAEASLRFGTRYEGRVHPDRWRVVPWSEQVPGAYPWSLELLLPVMRGEYRHREDARTLQRRLAGSVVVSRDSAEELVLRRYGTVMLNGEP